MATYLLEIADRDGRPIVGREILRYTRRHGRAGRPWHFLDFSLGRGTAITNEAAYGQEGATEQREERVLDDPSTLAIKGLGQFREFPVVSEFRGQLENWHISDFQISSARQSSDADFRNICPHAATTSLRPRHTCMNSTQINSNVSWTSCADGYRALPA